MKRIKRIKRIKIVMNNYKNGAGDSTTPALKIE